MQKPGYRKAPNTRARLPIPSCIYLAYSICRVGHSRIVLLALSPICFMFPASGCANSYIPQLPVSYCNKASSRPDMHLESIKARRSPIAEPRAYWGSSNYNSGDKSCGRGIREPAKPNINWRIQTPRGGCKKTISSLIGKLRHSDLGAKVAP